MDIVVEPEEREALMRWKYRSDTFVLVRRKSDAILMASEGVGTNIVARLVDRSEETVLGWFSDWREARMQSVVTGHAGNENAAKMKRDQKEQVRQLLASPPSDAGFPVAMWDVPTLTDVVKTFFDVEYESDSSYCALMRYCGMNFKKADPFDKRRDEEGITARMAEIATEVTVLLEQGYEVYAVDEVRVEHESETRRMWLPQGKRTKLYVDREKNAMSFFGALSLTTKKMKIYPIYGQQNTENIIGALTRLQRETPQQKIAVVLDNASFHTAAELKNLFAKGQELERITPIFLPPYAPDHNPVEHVWNAAKGHIANFQRQEPEHTYSAFMAYVTGRTFDYDFEHLPIKGQEPGFVS